MITFKEAAARDIHNVFLNPDEFAEEHRVNGRPMPVQLDENVLLERDKSRTGVHQDGLYRAQRLMFVSASDFGPRPAAGSLLELDGRQYKVTACTEEAGMYSIELGALRS